MAEYKDREHYIPLRKSDLVQLVCSDKQLSGQDQQNLRQFCVLISAIFHFEYLERLESLKDSFAPFNPDLDTKPLRELGRDEKEKQLDVLFQGFDALMERANYTKLTKADIDKAINAGASDWGINMDVDFSVFEKAAYFVRGEGRTKRTRRHPVFFWRSVEKEVDTYKRMILILKMRPHKRLPTYVNTSAVYIKVFKDIPKLDLEMFFPGARIQMPGSQRLKLGGSLIGTIGYALFKVWSDLLTATAVLVKGALFTAGSILWGPFILLAGYGYKQYAGFQTLRQHYSLQLAESLYFLNLSSNHSVLTYVLDEAEEQECREAILAYFALWRYAPPQGWTAEQLDDYIEMFLEGNAKLKVDFEIGDAMDKVIRLGLVEKHGEHFKAIPITQALERLDYRWDNYFQYNKG